VPDRITSTANPRIKAIARLKDRKGREESGRFLIEGHRELERAHDAGVPLVEAVLAPDLAGERELVLAAVLADAAVPVLEVGADAFARISMRQHPDGLLAVARRGAQRLGDLHLPDREVLVLVLDGVEKPGNLGAIVRTADGAGVDAVIVTGDGVEPTNPNAIRASQGAVFGLPVVVAPTDEVRAWLDGHDIRTVAASPVAAHDLWEADLTGSLAVVVGAEAQGVSEVFRSPDALVRIPMIGVSDSLNASVAAGIVLYEARRRRMA
jgi:TrmH family RNA methyltransferase